MDLGSFTLVGPLKQQSFTCVSGHSCSLQSFQVWHPRVQDQLMVMDTCGVTGPGDGFLQIPMVAESISTVESPGITAFSSGSQAVVAPGGRYRLCWYSQVDREHLNVSKPVVPRASFGVDAGELYLIGPEPLAQSQTCVVGQPCSWQTMTGLSPSDTWLVMALDTCGPPGPGSNLTGGHSTVGFPNSGLASTLVLELNSSRYEFNASKSGVATAGVLVTWGSTLVTAAGGLYRLCWCASLSSRSINQSNQSSGCVEASEFALDIGSLWLVGPPVHRFAGTCVSGRICRLHSSLFDSDPDAHGRLLVLDTCGSSALLPRWTWMATVEDSYITWGEPITALGGQYRLCWCRAYATNQTNDTAESQLLREGCNTADRFVMDIGAFHLTGPSAPVTRTCISGQTCHFEGFDPRQVSASDSIMLLETCGAVSRLNAGAAHSLAPSGAVVSWGDTRLTAAGGIYRLCWCGRMGDDDRNSTNISTCDLVSDHLVDAGSLVFMGPAPLQQDRTCISGRACRTHGISAVHPYWLDQIHILETCGTTAGVIPSRFPFDGLLPLSSNASNHELPLDFGLVSAPGGVYRLCWCSGLSQSGCISAADFQTDVGQMAILGFWQSQDRTCISGSTCTIDTPVGFGLTSLDSFAVLDTCGFTSSGLGSPSASVELNQKVSWGEVWTAKGGEYRLCWCSGLQASLNLTNMSGSERNESGCSLAWDFLVDAGRFLVQGMSPLSQHQTCVAGQACAMDVRGLALSEADSILALDTCGSLRGPFAGPSTLKLPTNISNGSQATWLLLLCFQSCRDACS